MPRPTVCILLCPKPDPLEQRAASELQRYIQELFGFKPRLVTRLPTSGQVLVLGTVSANRIGVERSAREIFPQQHAWIRAVRSILPGVCLCGRPGQGSIRCRPGLKADNQKCEIRCHQIQPDLSTVGEDPGRRSHLAGEGNPNLGRHGSRPNRYRLPRWPQRLRPRLAPRQGR